jgi:transcriptional regulator with XRE-family HTH domain
MEEMFFWGEKGEYGPFTTQEDGWPNAGEVIRHYRRKRKMSAGELAQLYGKAIGTRMTSRWILKMEQQNEVPSDIARRRLLSQILDIPPILLGLASREDIIYPQTSKMQEPNTSSPLKDPSLANSTLSNREQVAPPVLVYTTLDLERYKKEARVLWKLHYAQTAQDTIPDIIASNGALASIQETGKGDLKRHVSEIMNSYCRLIATIMRDNGDFEQAYLFADEGVRLAEAMGNDPYASQIISASQYTRGVVNFAWGVFGSAVRQGIVTFSKEKLEAALIDFEQALTYANPQLRGIIYSEMARAKALIAVSPTDVTIALKLLEQAEHFVGVDNHDDFYTQIILCGDLKGLDEKRMMLGRAKAFLAMKRPTQALEELDDLELQGSTSHTRRRGWTQIYYAQAAFALGNYSLAIDKAIGAFNDCKEVHSIAHLARVNELYIKLLTSPYKNNPELKQLGRLLSKIFSRKP